MYLVSICLEKERYIYMYIYKLNSVLFLLYVGVFIYIYRCSIFYYLKYILRKKVLLIWFVGMLFFLCNFKFGYGVI